MIWNVTDGRWLKARKEYINNLYKVNNCQLQFIRWAFFSYSSLLWCFRVHIMIIIWLSKTYDKTWNHVIHQTLKICFQSNLAKSYIAATHPPMQSSEFLLHILSPVVSFLQAECHSCHSVTGIKAIKQLTIRVATAMVATVCITTKYGLLSRISQVAPLSNTWFLGPTSVCFLRMKSQSVQLFLHGSTVWST